MCATEHKINESYESVIRICTIMHIFYSDQNKHVLSGWYNSWLVGRLND